MGSLTITSALIQGNDAVGGAGGLGGDFGAGGLAGDGQGGGIFVASPAVAARASITGSTITGNEAVGGLGGGAGGFDGGSGTTGGDGDGGGLFAGTGVGVALKHDSITTNRAVAGGAGTPGFGGIAGIAGQSVGGGILLTDPGSTALNTTITKNKAVTDPNVHGTLG